MRVTSPGGLVAGRGHSGGCALGGIRNSIQSTNNADAREDNGKKDCDY
jgi:hypothetical protein